MQQFQGRTAFLTGAASGIGRCLAIELAQAGCNLCLVDVNSEGLKQLAAEWGCDHLSDFQHTQARQYCVHESIKLMNLK